MRIIGRLRLWFWVCAVWAVVLYVFFVTLATISPAEVVWVTVVTVTLAAMATIRGIRVASVLADRGGDPRTRRALNRQRERRGF
jgi:hypothetical protein